MNEMRILRVIWGNSFDCSLSGLILAEDKTGRRNWYLGSRQDWSDEREDIDYILRWGAKLPEDMFTKTHEIDLL